MPTVRQYRVAVEISRCLASVLRRGAADPTLNQVDVRETRVSKDLSYAMVFVGIDGIVDPQHPEVVPIMSRLDKARPFLRRELSERMHLRRVPRLDFRYDSLEQTAKKIDDLLDSLDRPE